LLPFSPENEANSTNLASTEYGGLNCMSKSANFVEEKPDSSSNCIQLTNSTKSTTLEKRTYGDKVYFV